MEFIIDGFVSAIQMILAFDHEVYLILWTSLKVSICAVFLATFTGVPLGLLLALKNFPGKQTVALILNTSMALPTVVVGLLLYAFLSRRGPLGGLGLLFTPAGIVVGLFFLAVPLVTNLTFSGIQGMDARIFTTCKVLGATPIQQAVMILREARFQVMAGVVVAFGRVVSEVGIAMMLGGNIRGLTRTMTTAIALETSKGEFQLGMALGIFLLIVAFFVNLALFILQRNKI